MTQGPGVVVAAVLAVAYGVGGVVVFSHSADGGLVLGAAALHGVYAVCVRAKYEHGARGAPTRLLRATRVVLVLESIAALAFTFVNATVSMGCRDCQGAAILVAAPLFMAVVLTTLSMVLELVALLVLFLSRGGTPQQAPPV